MTTLRSLSRTALLATAMGLAATAAHAQRAYTVQTVGTHSGGTYPQFINDAGDVAGYHYPSGYQRAFLFKGGTFTDIGTFGGSYTWPQGMNASGHVVGYSHLPGDNTYHAFLFDGTMHDLGTLYGGYSYARGINASGQVIGHSDGYAFLYSGGVMQRLVDLLPAGSGWSVVYEATAINDAGQITGRGYHSTLGYRSFLFTPASGSTPATIVAIGTSSSMDARFINASGQVAGAEWSGTHYRTFLFTPGSGGGTFTYLPDLGGYMYPYDLNDSGQIVGQAYSATHGTYRAFLYSGGQTTDIQSDPPSVNGHARAINDHGAIVGYSNGPFVRGADGASRRVGDLVSGCNWSVNDAVVINNNGQVAGNGWAPALGHRGFALTPVDSQTATVVTASNASGPYSRPIQLQARVTAACSAVSDVTVSFAVNGSARGSATTDPSGWARLTVTMPDVVVGTYTDGIEASFAGDADFNAHLDTANLTVYKATPILTWTPAAIVEGTPLGAAQLNAAADTPGNFYYSPAAGTVLGPGLRRLWTSFVPSDTANYNSTSIDALLPVRASNPVISYDAVSTTGLGGTYVEMRALNNAGQAVGWAGTPNNTAQHAVLFSGGVTTDLGTLGGTHSAAEDINDAGQATGWAYTANNNTHHAFVYSGGTMTDIGVLLPSWSQGTAINTHGDVAVYGRSTSGYSHAYLYTASAGTMTYLGTLNAGQYSIPRDINASRQVVGTSYTSNGCYHAFLATTAGMQDLGTLGGQCSEAMAINDAGDVVGWAQNAAGQNRPFLYRNGQMTDLGSLGGTYGVAVAVSADGTVTGYSYDASNRPHAFRWANGVMTDLGVIYNQSIAQDINDSNNVVGYSYTTEGHQTAVVERGNGLLDVNSLINVGQTAGVQEARRISDTGYILARGYSGGMQRWYVLSPTTLASSSLTLSASGAVYQGTTTLTATLTMNDPAGSLVTFRLNGTVVGTAAADANGVATLAGVSVGAMNAGTHTAAASASFAGNVDYAGSTAATDVVIAKATPAISWPQPAAIVYGTPLSSTQLNATTTVAGSFSFSPAHGQVLGAGNHALGVTFTPANQTNYEIATATVTLTVLKATPSITWATPADIVYGTALSGTQLNASSPIPGSFTYAPVAGTLLNAGSGQILTAQFTPTDTANYASANASVAINVLKATPSITWATPADIVYGTALSGTQLSASSPVPGSFSYSPAAGTQLNAGNGQLLTAQFTPTDTANYASANASVAINVLKATPPITWATPADIVYGTALSGTQLNASSPVAGSFSYSPAAGTQLNAGSGQVLSVQFTPTDTSNYVSAGATVAITVLKATPSITWATPADIVYGTALSGTQLNASSPVAGSFTYAPVAGTLLNAGSGQLLTAQFTPTDTANYASASASVAIKVLKAPSSVTVAGGVFLHDGQPHPATGTVSGVGGVIGVPSMSYTPGGASAPVAPGIYQVLAAYPGDANHLPSSNTASIVINAVPAVTSLTGPSAPLAINSSGTITAAFDDGATGDSHTCTFAWNDGTADTSANATAGAGTCSATHPFTEAGVYTVDVTVTDDDGYSAGASFKYVVVYDPSGGFVTGGGWIDSPAGAYTADASLAGKATFGFVSKYLKGATVPTGNTEFEFHVGSLRFRSTSYEWLVVSGARAQYKGAGTINGAGSYGFLLTALDGGAKGGGGVDKFRIKIWDLATGTIVYDNRLGSPDDLTADPQAIGGGSIVIHSK